jgi:hypothetical protein
VNNPFEDDNWKDAVVLGGVQERTVAMMLTLLDGSGPVFAELHERKVERNRWINGLTVQTADPAYE